MMLWLSEILRTFPFTYTNRDLLFHFMDTIVEFHTNKSHSFDIDYRQKLDVICFILSNPSMNFNKTHGNASYNKYASLKMCLKICIEKCRLLDLVLFKNMFCFRKCLDYKSISFTNISCLQKYLVYKHILFTNTSCL